MTSEPSTEHASNQGNETSLQQRMNRMGGAWALLAATVVCSSCSAGPKIVVGPTVALTPRTLAHGDVFDSVDDFAFPEARLKAIGPDERAFVDAVELLRAGRNADAAASLGPLLQSGELEVKKRASEVLGNLLAQMGFWQRAAELTPDDSFLRAFSGQPAEQYEIPSTNTIPITLGPSGSPMVEVNVNGHRKRFWIDTGAGMTTIASDTALECGVTPIESYGNEASTGTSKTVSIKPAVVDELVIGDTRLSHHHVIVINSRDLTLKIGWLRTLKIDGIIGWPAIRRIDLEIDYAARSATIRKPVRRDGPHNLFWFGYPIVAASDPEGVPLYFGVDTGSSSTTVTHRLLEKIHRSAGERRRVRRGSAGGFEAAEVAVLSDLSIILDGRRVEFKSIQSVKMADSVEFRSLDGILGSDVAGLGRIRIDYSNGQFDFQGEPR